MNIIEFKDFSFTYAGADSNALKGINLAIEENKITIFCGRSGSGKTTLLKSIKQEVAPCGIINGSIHSKVASNEISMVFQNPDVQLVCGSVLYDLVFHMENIGLPPKTIKKRLAETVCFFGIEQLLHKNPEELSGGQKQLVALCSALMTYPKLLILDEPLSQLDPIATTEFLELLKRINEEFAVSIVMCEHRLSECIAIADTLAILENGKLKSIGTPKKVMEDIWGENDEAFLCFIPDITKAALKLTGKALFSPKDLKMELRDISYAYKEKNFSRAENIAVAKNIVFSYPNTDRHILKRLDLEIEKSKISCIFGGNGSGKSTFLKLLVGINKGFLGNLKVTTKKIAYMPQNVSTYFSADTVYNEIVFDGFDQYYYNYLMDALKIKHLEKRHPFDLSGGESARVCLASILLKKPELVVLDEPTRGLDIENKRILIKLLKENATTALIATHDLEFAASYADRCVMLFDGDIAFEDTPHNFFKENRYYTTSISKAFRLNAKDVVTYKDVQKLLP